MPHQKHITLVITHNVKSDKFKHYEAWLKKIMPIAENHPGHLGVSIIRPDRWDSAYTVLLRFDNIEHLYLWQKSPERKRHTNKLSALINIPENLEIRSGAEFWLTPTQARNQPTPKWKQYFLSLLMIFPTVNIINTILESLFPGFIFSLSGNFISNAIIVACVVYFLMPLATHLFHNWLIPKKEINNHEQNIRI